MRTLFFFLFFVFNLQTALWAQEANILGLPAVPQMPPAAVPGTAGTKPGVSSAKPSAAALKVAQDLQDAQIKSVINGAVQMFVSYTSTLAITRITTNNTYTDETQRNTALLAARLVQRDIHLSCGRQCKPGKMGPGKILPDNRLQFEMIVSGLPRVITQDDMVNMLLAKPLAVIAVAPPAAAPVPAPAAPLAKVPPVSVAVHPVPVPIAAPVVAPVAAPIAAPIAAPAPSSTP